MEIKYYGHSCFAVKINDKTILFDPFITFNPLVENFDLSTVEADYILVSHGHEDHIANCVEIAKNTGAKIYSNFEIISWLGSQGAENGHPMNHGGSVQIDGIGTAKFVNAIHSSVLPDGTYGGNPGGWVIESNKGNFYFAGDTALTYDMKLLGESHNLDFAILPIGDNFTMGIDDSIRAAQFCGVNKVIPMHYNTFPYVEISIEEAKQKYSAANIELNVFEIGATKTL